MGKKSDRLREEIAEAHNVLSALGAPVWFHESSPGVALSVAGRISRLVEGDYGAIEARQRHVGAQNARINALEATVEASRRSMHEAHDALDEYGTLPTWPFSVADRIHALIEGARGTACGPDGARR